MISRGAKASVKALRPRRRRAKRGLDTGRASAMLWLSGACHSGIPHHRPRPNTLTDLIRVRGLWFYLVRSYLLLNRTQMGHVAAEFLPERRCIVRINLRVIASTRDSDIGHAAVEQILSAQLSVHVNQAPRSGRNEAQSLDLPPAPSTLAERKKWEITVPLTAEFFPLRFLYVRLLTRRTLPAHRGSASRFVVVEPVRSHTRLLPLHHLDDSVEHL
jgi:hypothetical protein